VSAARAPDDIDSPGRAFWLLALVGLPLLGFPVALAAPSALSLTSAILLACAVDGVVALAVLPLLPQMRRRRAHARVAWAVVGGVAAAMASIGWIGGAAVASLFAECLPNGCP
jgi:hypothetical protein